MTQQYQVAYILDNRIHRFPEKYSWEEAVDVARLATQKDPTREYPCFPVPMPGEGYPEEIETQQLLSFAYGNLKIDRPELKREDVEKAMEDMK